MKSNNNSFKYFILITIVPIIGIISIFSLAYNYVYDEITIVKKEIIGLEKSNQLQNIILNMQRLRGLSNIVIKSEATTNKIKTLKLNITDNLHKLQDQLNSNNNFQPPLKKRLILYGDTVINYLNNDEIKFNKMSSLIQQYIILLKYIAYNTTLILDNGTQSHILIETIVSILPELIEYNGQIRGISSSLKGTLKNEDKDNILIQISKIQDRIATLTFSMSQLNNIKNININLIYKDMLNAQHSLLNFTKKEILEKDIITLNPDNIFQLHSNNIDIISLLYKTNSQELHKILSLRLEDKNKILVFIFVVGLFSILFIIYINNSFFRSNKKFIKHIKLLSITDSMTTLYNRRYFDDTFTRQLKIQQRAKRNMIFLMMDIDYFKQYNDIYGHQDGDKTLIAVAKSLKENLKRPDDLVFRLGGEEFGVLCTGMNEDEAFNFANKLRNNIEKLKIEHSGNSASKFVTISIGFAVLKPECNNNMNTIYKDVDEAMYTAKENGRNQVSIAKTS